MSFGTLAVYCRPQIFPSKCLSWNITHLQWSAIRLAKEELRSLSPQCDIEWFSQIEIICKGNISKSRWMDGSLCCYESIWRLLSPDNSSVFVSHLTSPSANNGHNFRPIPSCVHSVFRWEDSQQIVFTLSALTAPDCWLLPCPRVADFLPRPGLSMQFPKQLEDITYYCAGKYSIHTGHSYLTCLHVTGNICRFDHPD